MCTFNLIFYDYSDFYEDFDSDFDFDSDLDKDLFDFNFKWSWNPPIIDSRLACGPRIMDSIHFLHVFQQNRHNFGTTAAILM